MPSWIMHFAVANKVSEKLGYNNEQKNEFIFANIAPDIFEGYLVKDLSNLVRDYSTHFPEIMEINGMNIPIPNVDRFIQKYKSKLDNPVICGYLCHLLIDRFWNTYTYGKYLSNFNREKKLVVIKNKDGGKDIESFSVASKRKQKDFKNFCKYIKNNYKIDFPYYSKKILKDINELEEFKFEEEDIKKTINYIENNLKNVVEKENNEYKMFTLDELLKKHNESIDYVLENLTKN